jgi:microcystin-dependent protein
VSIYALPGAMTQMAPMMVQPAGGGLQHNNVQPFLGLNICIAMQGNFPTFS